MAEKTRVYSEETKREVVERFLEGHRAVDLQEQFGIKNRRRIYDWVHKVKDANSLEALKDTRGVSNKGRKKEISLAEENEQLKLENLYLKKLLDLKRG